MEKHNLQKVSLLRALCKSVGIQVLLREYALDSKTRQSFYEEDIQTVFPVVKHIHPKVLDTQTHLSAVLAVIIVAEVAILHCGPEKKLAILFLTITAMLFVVTVGEQERQNSL